MKNNNDTIYEIIVHAVNLLLLGCIGILAFFSVVNISPNQNPTSDMIAFITIAFLTAMWAFNYWLQLKRKKWILPIAGTVLYVAISLFFLDVGIPFIYDVFIR